jgi:enamine deaminase RidA (YjgF/YER057c/UK114 family)
LDPLHRFAFELAIVGRRVPHRAAPKLQGGPSMPSNLRFMNPPAIAKPGGYSHVVEITGPGRIVYIAGQLGLKPDGSIAGDFRAQAMQAFENLKSALAAVGATFDDVVKLNNYLIDIPANLGIYREVRDKYVNVGQPPASTTVGVPALARPDALYEVEAVVMLAK